MEFSDGGASAEKKSSPPQPAEGGGGSGGGEKSTKRKMKTAFQLELLEKTYAMSPYPKEEVRAELSTKIGLSDRQLQMWFCHRRLKDRKANEMAATTTAGSGSVSGSSPPPGPRKALARMSAPAVAEPPLPMVRGRYYDVLSTPQQSISELRAIAFVDSQLGERIREDGPILGVVFDPLPPGAFGAPIEPAAQQKYPMRSYDGKVLERHDVKSFKASPFLPTTEQCLIPGSSAGKRKAKASIPHLVHSQAAPRPVHEYQFLPEQPSVLSDGHDRLASSHFYDSSVPDTVATRVSPLRTGGLFLHGNDQATPVYKYQDQAPLVQGTQHIFPFDSAEHDNYPHKALYPASGSEVPFGPQHENPFITPDRRINREEDAVRVERKRKSEEARIAKEVEAHEKRIRRELEKQDILRRKREEQMRREMERHDRERKKEEERIMREKQREEERYQRELRREHERREKFLQKENLRAEKMKLKEETRREKEAARIKAANERATARRIAREYMELIEDERLELMELASSSKGLPSIISLDGDTLQNLDLFRDMLNDFPPKSASLKKPFAVQPWVDSEENVGNLLMVWRFLITFADVLSLWPFTLDEFMQSLHDYDSRLLGEIHIALLRCIIKDIEDVARTPAISLGGNHNGAANPGGGHPVIVEGAYAWGFDILSWQNHLNPLTWPEILRQFALAAGFGPQLKKRSVERAYFRDENEGHDGEDIISTLRSGMAAENALAVMQEKGFSHLRRSRHRLTPGTVKFAAFHVLSLEGSRGLTILEVADKIQKSGLRDLTTSKTPEASIAAALSRDTKLFERTAPSTYCVRSAYRKDPADAESILAAAREKIQVFQNGFSESEAEKDTEDADDAERDESDSDGADDPEIDGMNTEANLSEVPNHYKLKSPKENNCFGNGKTPYFGGTGMDPHSQIGSLDKTLPLFSEESLKEKTRSDALNNNFLDASSEKIEVQDAEIDESNCGQPWVQGLTEGEYSDISVEERLNALVSLVGVAIEGNTIRVILEERLEAANALKKQMWTEVQLDKRRVKEEYMSRLEFSSMGTKVEMSTIANVDESQSPFVGIDDKGDTINLNATINGKPFDLETSNNLNTISSERNIIGEEFPTNPDGCQPQPNGYVSEKSRSQVKSYIGHKAEQVYVYRSLPIGQDRRHSRYWQFVASASKNDPGCGRIFFESKDGFWRLIDSKEAFDSLLAALDTRGIRESHLHSMLQKMEPSFKETIERSQCFGDSSSMSQGFKKDFLEMACTSDCGVDIESPQSAVCGLSSDLTEHSSSFKIELGQSESQRSTAMKRYQDFQGWLWKECFNSAVMCAMKYEKRCPELLEICNGCYTSYFPDEKHCPSCHRTFKDRYNLKATFSEHVYRCEERRKVDPRSSTFCSDSSLPIGFQTLKAQLVHIESSIPYEALQPFWTDSCRKSWSVKLQSSSSPEELFQVLTILESAIKRDYLSPSFETTNELLRSSAPVNVVDDVIVHWESVQVLPWIPHTTSAVALRLMDLDISVFYVPDQKLESLKEKDFGEFTKLPSKNSFADDIPDEPIETADIVDPMIEYNWADPGVGRSSNRGRGSRGKGGRGRGRGGRPRGSTSSTRSEYKENRGRNPQRTTTTAARRQTRGRTRGRGRRSGRRSARPRQIPRNRVFIRKDVQLGSFLKSNSIRSSSVQASRESSEERDEWRDEATPQVYAEDEDNVASFSGSEDNGQASVGEYDEQVADYSGAYGSSRHGALSDDESEEEEEDLLGDGTGNLNEDADGDYANEDMEDDLDEDEDIVDEDGEEAADFERNGEDDNASYSSGYSD